MSTTGQPQSSVIDGRFVKETEHKRGGMGTVWRARDLHTERPIALKILHDTSPDQSQRFLREGALLSDLQHPGIVEHLAHGITAGGVPYIAMAWLDGETVAERLARQALTLHESLAVVRSALRGLAAAHRRGVVHRDLKPSNLFLRQGRIEDVVLLDLGIARHFDGSSELTRTGSILGTPSYMAPEQAQGQRDLGPPADVFSLGCVLFECVAGEPPFVGAHVLSVLAKVLFEEPPRLSDLRPELPAAVSALVARMLAKDPARRPRDAAELLAALDTLDAVPDAAAPRPAPSPPAPSSSTPRLTGIEQELVSVVLMTRAPPPRDAAGPTAATAAEPPEPLELPDLSGYGGEVKRLGDGTTVITLAQRGGSATDLAARAARCALRLRRGRPGARFVVATGRGIPSGPVHIGEAVDRAGGMLQALAGANVTTADVESAVAPADAGAIWLDELTAGLLDARFHTTRGRDERLPFVLGGEDPSLDPGRRLLGRPTTCVGREHELAMLQLALAACVDESSPRAVLVVGPPGIGKSRLRHELLRHVQLAGAPHTVLLGLGDPIRAAGTRGLLGGAVARLCGVRAELSDSENRAALTERIGRHIAHPEDRLRTAVFMGELCGTRFPADTLPELASALHSPNIMSDLLAQAWLTFVRAEAARGTVVLALDDLQWSDPHTVALVGAALRGLPSSPLMVLALARPEAPDLFPDLWAPRLTTLPLQPLGRGATARLVRQVLGAEITEDTVARIVERAGGNALYLEELIRAAEARRDAIPGTVLAMLQARIGLLPAPTRRVLRAASVFGEEFPLKGVEALLAAAGAAGDLAPALATLSKHEILEQPPEERGPARWRFRHALMRDAAYGLCTAEDLTAWHALAARALEAAGEDPAVVAAHHERSGDRASAVRHYIAAADQAYRRNDLAGVVALVDRGLACGAAGEDRGILRSVETPARFYRNELAASAAASDEAVALLPPGHRRRTRSLAWSTYTAMHMGKGIEAEARVEELLATQPAEADRGSYGRSLGDIFLSYAVLGNRARAALVLDRIVAIDAEMGAADPLAHAHMLYWRTRHLELLGDDPHAAWVIAQQAVSFYAQSGDRRMHACSQVEVGECARRLYSVEGGIATMREAVRLAEEIDEPVITSFVQQYLAVALAEYGAVEDLPEARRLAQSAMDLGEGSAYHALGQGGMALCELRAGNLEGAEAHARQSRATFRTIGLRAFFPLVDATLLRVLLARGDVTAAAPLADEALALVDDQGPFGTVEMPLRLAAARAHLLAGRRDAAARGIERALAHLHRRAAPIPDATMRERFYTAVPEHAGLLALERELGGGKNRAQF